MLEFTYEFDEAIMSIFIGNNSDALRKWTVICKFKSNHGVNDVYSGEIAFIDSYVYAFPDKEENQELFSKFNPNTGKKFDEYFMKLGSFDFTKTTIKGLKDKDLQIKLEALDNIIMILSSVPGITNQPNHDFFNKLMLQIIRTIKVEQDERDHYKKLSTLQKFMCFFGIAIPSQPPTTVAPAVYRRIEKS